MRGRPCIFGEVLFDRFPDGDRVLGGAPFNVAWHLHAFGERPLFVSRVGQDADGAAVLDAMRSWGMDSSGVQTDRRHATGRVNVSFHDGEPSYEIVQPSAWDLITAPEPVPRCALLYHGSLALRNRVSRSALEQIRAIAAPVVFMDVNLRAPWWRPDELPQWLEGANWVKLNQEEFSLLAAERESAPDFLARYRLDGLVLTHGEEGAELLTRSGQRFAARPEPGIEVTDTVGAGDALSAVMILGLSRRWDLGQTLSRAQAFASALVSRRGATVSKPAFYAEFRQAWGLAETAN
jgi:fructokinase